MREQPADSHLIERSRVLDQLGVARALKRMAYEILERAGGSAYLVGIRTGGAFLADRLAKILKDDHRGDSQVMPIVGAVDITLYRDDVFLGLPKPEVGPTELPESINGRTVVLVDDVLYTGRTVRAAMDVLLDYGRPRAIKLAVLVDRGCRELPIQPDFVGVQMQTTPNQSVRVCLAERSEEDGVLIRERAAESAKGSTL